jgi:hypothetical protein
MLIKRGNTAIVPGIRFAYRYPNPRFPETITLRIVDRFRLIGRDKTDGAFP